MSDKCNTINIYKVPVLFVLHSIYFLFHEKLKVEKLYNEMFVMFEIIAIYAMFNFSDISFNTYNRYRFNINIYNIIQSQNSHKSLNS